MPKKIKSIDTNTPNYKQPSQFNVEKGIKPDRIKPEKIFDGYNKEQSSNRKTYNNLKKK